MKRFNGEFLPIPRQFLGILNHALGIEVRAWKSQLEPWSGLIEPARQFWGEQIVFLLTAIYAAGRVDLRIGRECQLTNQHETLCDRAAYAKQRSDDSEWWREQLASASVTGVNMVQFVVLAMQRFTPIEVILTLSREISDVLDFLADLPWHQLARASSNLEAPAGSLGSHNVAVIYIAKAGRPAHKSPFS